MACSPLAMRESALASSLAVVLSSLRTGGQLRMSRRSLVVLRKRYGLCVPTGACSSSL